MVCRCADMGLFWFQLQMWLRSQQLWMGLIRPLLLDVFLLSTPSLYLLSAWAIMASNVLANVPLPRCCFNLLFHLSAILFRLQVSAAGVTLLSQNVTRHSGSCSLTWHSGGDRQESKFDDKCCFSLCSAASLLASMLAIPG